MGRVAKIVLTIVGVLVLIILYYLISVKPTHQASKKVEESVKAVHEFTEEWKEYRPQSDRFVVTFPSLPQHAAQMIPIPDGDGFIRYDMYIAQSRNGVTFMINVIEYPQSHDMNDVDNLLNGIMREMLGGNSSNALLNNDKATFSGNPALEFLIQNKEATMKTMAVQKDHTIYVVSAAAGTTERAEENFKKLISSFSIN